MKSAQKLFRSVASLIVTFAFSVLLMSGCYQGVSNSEILQLVEVQTSPSNHVAMLVERSDHAALSGNTFFVFVSDHAYPLPELRQHLYALHPVFKAGLGGLSIDWSKPNELTIECHSCGDTKNIIETQMFAQNGVVIRYAGFP